MAKIYCSVCSVLFLFLGSHYRLPAASLTPPPIAVVKPAPAKKPDITEVYLSQIGVREATGKNDGKEVEKYLKSVGLGKGYAWCSAFVKWCFDQAGVKTTITAWSPSAQNSKRLIYSGRKFNEEPKPGDVGCLYYPKLKRIGHTYFYHARLNDKVYISVEGNTNDAGSREGDGVYKKYRSFNSTHSISRWN